jgi:hypothetical protein
MTSDAGDGSFPVIMSLWKRLPLLDRSLFQLAHQEGVRPTVYLLNNNPHVKQEVEKEVARYRSRLAIHVVHSDNSLSCFGRFVLARRIRNGSPFLFFIDDDQAFDRTFLRTLWHERTEGGITGCHAHRFRRSRDYWRKERSKAGRGADYCGPGGMIIDSRLLDQPALLRAPPEALIMDDIWLSYVANHVLKAPIRKSSAAVEMTDMAGDTWPTIHSKKIEFLEELRRRGWKV